KENDVALGLAFGDRDSGGVFVDARNRLRPEEAGVVGRNASGVLRAAVHTGSQGSKGLRRKLRGQPRTSQAGVLRTTGRQGERARRRQEFDLAPSPSRPFALSPCHDSLVSACPITYR